MRLLAFVLLVSVVLATFSPQLTRIPIRVGRRNVISFKPAAQKNGRIGVYPSSLSYKMASQASWIQPRGNYLIANPPAQAQNSPLQVSYRSSTGKRSGQANYLLSCQAGNSSPMNSLGSLYSNLALMFQGLMDRNSNASGVSNQDLVSTILYPVLNQDLTGDIQPINLKPYVGVSTSNLLVGGQNQQQPQAQSQQPQQSPRQPQQPQQAQQPQPAPFVDFFGDGNQPLSSNTPKTGPTFAEGEMYGQYPEGGQLFNSGLPGDFFDNAGQNELPNVRLGVTGQSASYPGGGQPDLGKDFEQSLDSALPQVAQSPATTAAAQNRNYP